MHDPIRGDIPHRQTYVSDVGVEEDLLGSPGRNAFGRVFVSRPMSVMSPTERTVVGDGPPPGPVSRRGSRLVSPAESHVPPVSVFFFRG
jgi:hypothetical protein